MSLRIGVLALVAGLVLGCAGGTKQAEDEATNVPAAPEVTAGRIQVSAENPRYFERDGEAVFPIGITESGADSCGTANGWMPISSDFDWQPDLERMIANGGNNSRVIPYFPGHPNLPWARTADGRYDLGQFNETWLRRLRDYLDWTASHGVIVQLEVFENYSFVREDPWEENPFNPGMNVNYSDDVIDTRTTREHAAIYEALDSDNDEALIWLERYVARLVEESMRYDNVIYTVTNESNAPLDWSEYWADYIHRYASSRGFEVLVGEMPHTYEPTAGLEPVAASDSFDFVDASSQTSEDRFGDDDEAAIVTGTDAVLSELAAVNEKPVTMSKIYYRSPATLWSKFINGAASAQYHRNCDRGGSDEDEPERYFEYVKHLRAFVDEIDLAAADSMDDGLAEASDGVHADVLAATGRWYAVHLYREAGDSEASVSLKLPESAELAARWFNPATGEWTDASAEAESGGRRTFASPGFETSLALLVQIEGS